MNPNDDLFDQLQPDSVEKHLEWLLIEDVESEII